MKAFRERNPLLIGAAGIAVLAAGMVAALNAKNLPVLGPETATRPRSPRRPG